MTAPAWIASLVSDFGKGAGLQNFALGDRDTAALSFENGYSLRFEYAAGGLMVAMAVPSRLDAAHARALLAYSHPEARLGFRVRAGYLQRRGAAFFSIRLEERDVTLPAINQAFAIQWRIAQEYGGVA